MPNTATTPRMPMDAMANLAHFHREHEKYYAIAPIGEAEVVLGASRTLKALADRWSQLTVAAPGADPSPYAGCEDLNDAAAIEMSGVLFLEGGGTPMELQRLKQQLRSQATANEDTGGWLDNAMETSWASAGALVHLPPLADLLGERHRIIANNLLAASMTRLAARLVSRAVDLLDAIELTPEGVRADLAGSRSMPGYLYSAAMLLDRAADLALTSTTLTRDSEPSWRAWQARLDLVRYATATGEQPSRSPADQ